MIRPPPSAVPPARSLPALGRDPWALVSLLSVAALFIHALGAPLGEPVAEDFDFLRYARLGPAFSWWDGGGSTTFWRPVAQQFYFRMLGGVLVTHPAWVVVIHVVLLAIATLAIYRALREAWSPRWAVFAASFSSLSESSRGLLTWSSHFADLGAWVFTALCLHEVWRRRLPTALAFLLLGLWCKEVTGIAALLLPFVPGIGPPDLRGRLRWAAAFAALTGCWAVVNGVVRARSGLHLYHGIGTTLWNGVQSWLVRFDWSLTNGMRAMLSQPAAPAAMTTVWLAAGASLFIVAGAMLMSDPRARERMRRALPIAAFGAAWYGVSVLSVALVHPYWAPNRSHYGGFGFATFTAATLGSVHPGLLAGAAVLKIATFAASPRAPDHIDAWPKRTGAFLDFAQLTRHQRLARATRIALTTKFPAPPHGATIAWLDLPKRMEYVFGGSTALHVWYSDTTLRFVPLPEALALPRGQVLAFLAFEPLEGNTPAAPATRGHRASDAQMVLIDNDAMWSYLDAVQASDAGDANTALAALARANAEHHAGSRVFAASVAGARALVLDGVGRSAESATEARRSVALWPTSPDGRVALAWSACRAERWADAQSALDTLLLWVPGDSRGPDLARWLAHAREAGIAPRAEAAAAEPRH